MHVLCNLISNQRKVNLSTKQCVPLSYLRDSRIIGELWLAKVSI